MKKILLLLFVIFSMQSQAQSTNGTYTNTKWNFGVELDILPYVTGGYFGAGWIGKDKWRGRVLFADVNKPNFVTKDGFSDHHIKAYAAILDRFLKDSWKGWWIGGGPVYWKSDIQSDSSNATQNFDSFLLNGSLGYNFTISKNFYVSPWAGLSLKIGGNDEFVLDNKEYNLPLLNPEASVKFGFYF